MEFQGLDDRAFHFLAILSNGDDTREIRDIGLGPCS
jgi:hypothetical protein